MSVMAIHHTHSLTQERYEEVVRRLTDGKTRLESPSDLPFEGLLVHVAAQTDSGFVIFDVFESEEAFARFGQIVEPIAREVGIEEPPRSYPAHTYISGAPGLLVTWRRSTAVVPTATSYVSRSFLRGDTGDGGDGYGHIYTPATSAGGRAVAGSNPVAPTIDGRFKTLSPRASKVRRPILSTLATGRRQGDAAFLPRPPSAAVRSGSPSAHCPGRRTRSGR
jgi:hypothetical protein